MFKAALFLITKNLGKIQMSIKNRMKNCGTVFTIESYTVMRMRNYSYVQQHGHISLANNIERKKPSTKLDILWDSLSS